MRYENGWIFADGRFVRGGFSVENGRFAHVLEDVPGPAEDLDGALVIPGLVDIHVHGCAGADFSDGDYAGLVRMARHLARRGVTSFAPASRQRLTMRPTSSGFVFAPLSGGRSQPMFGLMTTL